MLVKNYISMKDKDLRKLLFGKHSSVEVDFEKQEAFDFVFQSSSGEKVVEIPINRGMFLYLLNEIETLKEKL